MVTSPSGQVGIFDPKNFLEGAGIVDIKPYEPIFPAGAGRGNVYLVIGGSVSILPTSESGRATKLVTGTAEIPAIIGATAYLTLTDPGRNAGIETGPEGAKVIVIPPKTAAKYWNPPFLATPEGDLKRQLEIMTKPARSGSSR